MLRLIFFLFLFFLVVSFVVIRTLVRALRRAFFFIKKGGSGHSEASAASFSSESRIEEADYEVIASRLNNKDQDDL